MHRATTTAVQMEAPVPEITETLSYFMDTTIQVLYDYQGTYGNHST
jgi:hypothetical protein